MKFQFLKKYIKMNTFQVWWGVSLIWGNVTQPLPSTQMSKEVKMHWSTFLQFQSDFNNLKVDICRYWYWTDTWALFSLLLVVVMCVRLCEAESKLQFSAEQFFVSWCWRTVFGFTYRKKSLCSSFRSHPELRVWIYLYCFDCYPGINS